jgi:hypothetical protein
VLLVLASSDPDVADRVAVVVWAAVALAVAALSVVADVVAVVDMLVEVCYQMVKVYLIPLHKHVLNGQISL